MLITEVAVLLERLGDYPFELNRQIRIQACHDRGPTVQNGVQNGRRAFAAKGCYSCGHLVEYCAKAENICAGIEFLPAGLLRRHVRQCAQRCSLFCERGSCSQICSGGHIPGRMQLFGEPKVKQLCKPLRSYENVRGLDVPMNDA